MKQNRKNRNSDVVTSSHHDSEEEESVDDSGEDWQPEKKKGAGAGAKGKRKSTTTSPKGRGGKKSKKDESEEESEDEEEDEEEDESEEEEDDESDEDGAGKGKKTGSTKKSRASVGKNQPDKDGIMELYLFKNDLTKDFRTDEKLCMWRRDGASLLQKYMVNSDESQNNDIIFKASSVYSCWEEKRKNDFFQIKVQLVGDKKEGKVKVVDIAEFERYAVEDRPKVDITPKGAEGGENYEEGSEDEFDENEEDED